MPKIINIGDTDLNADWIKRVTTSRGRPRPNTRPRPKLKRESEDETLNKRESVVMKPIQDMLDDLLAKANASRRTKAQQEPVDDIVVVNLDSSLANADWVKDVGGGRFKRRDIEAQQRATEILEEEEPEEE